MPIPGIPVPPTVIVVHPRERRSKCSVEPLRDRDGFLFCTFPHPGTDRHHRLCATGDRWPDLSEADSDRGLLLLDGTWRLAARMEPFFQHVEVRSLPMMQTAYPRKSEVYADPSEGLATIEALYAALRLLNRDTTGLLDHYHWREQFLHFNPWLRTARQ